MLSGCARFVVVSLAACTLLTGCGGGAKTETVRTQRSAAPSSVPDRPVRPPGPAEAPSKPGQQVVLLHCGVQNVEYEGLEWEVENAPFDAGSAPEPTFSGFGTFSRTGDSLTFTDREGAVLHFSRWDGTPDPATCA